MLKKSERIIKEFVYDFSKDAGTIGTQSLKAVGPNGNTFDEGLLIVDLFVVVEAAVTSAGTPTVTIGNTSSSTGYMADIFSKVGAINSTVRSGEVDGSFIWDTTNDSAKAYRIGSAANVQDLTLSIGTAALTAGRLRFIIEGVLPGSTPRA